jgi:transposase-like protein
VVMVSFTDVHVATEIILTCVRWYLAYPLSYRQRLSRRLPL